MLGVTLLAYSPILFNFFLGDDFVHLSWLSRCIHDPSLLLKNFYSSWLDVVTTKFYRPLISVFMLSDYAVWRTNGFGFHLTNVFFHLINCFFVYRIAAELFGKLRLGDYKLLPSTPAMAALLFGLYPLHAEPVAWITGRVDTVVTTFYLGAVFTYIRWQVSSCVRCLITSLVMTTLALMSKEMAVTIPAAVSLLELWKSLLEKQSLSSAIARIAMKTYPFWLLLIAYFIVRRLALGTFVGGYDDSLFFVANWGTFISGWLSGIKMTLLPTNREVMSAHNIFSIGWCVALLTSLVGVAKAVVQSETRSRIALLIGLLGLSITPVYKIFAISADLEGSRLVYLTSSFFCMLLAAGLGSLFNFDKNSGAEQRDEAPLKLLAPLTIGLFGVCAFAILWRNNLVWRDAGLECAAIRAGLEQIAKSVPEDSHLLLLGLPDQKHGAYICRNASPGAIEPPQFSKALKDCIFLNTFESVFPFGYLRRSLQENKDAVKIFCWNTNKREFSSVQLSTQKSPQHGTAGKDSFHSDAHNLDGWATEFVLNSHVAENNTTPSSSTTEVAVLTNNLIASAGGEPQIAGQRLDSNARHGELFPLRSIPLWACGADGQIHLQGMSKTAEAFERIPADELMPILGFANSGYLGSKGFLHLDQAHDKERLYCLKNDVPGADHFMLEIMRPNVFVDPTSEQNGTSAAKQQLKEIQASTKTGSIELSRKDLQGHGLYQARLWSVDKNNRRLGVAGDHIIIDVND
ncbi:MAG TPA: hypothetical protein V6C86_09090 [Oculatellaceae cyanobacterium]